MSAVRVLACAVEPDEVGLLGGAELEGLAAEPAFGHGDLQALVLILMRSDSNSAIIARTLNSSRPIGSFGSWTDPPMLSFTSAAVAPGEAVVDLDPFRLHVEGGEAVASRGQVLVVGRATCISDEHRSHDRTAPLELPSPDMNADGSYGIGDAPRMLAGHVIVTRDRSVP